MQTKLNRYNPDLVDQVRKNMDLARVDPHKLAIRCKELGVSSFGTYVKDIERSILKILALIDAEKPSGQE